MRSTVENVWEVRTTEVTTQHKIQHKEAILIILERITHVDDEWVIDLETAQVKVGGRQCEPKIRHTSSSSRLS